MSNRENPEINAGSMADIAFLLLIFFLVTTTLNSETGIQKRLTDKTPSTRIDVNEKNVLEIRLNTKNEILIENNLIIPIENLKQMVVDFIDNGAGNDIDGNTCDWCLGKKDPNSSDHPTKAIIQLQSARNTSYGHYVTAQNEIISAYTDLRNITAISLYNKSYVELLNDLKKDRSNKALLDKIKMIKLRYPLLILEETQEK